LKKTTIFQVVEFNGEKKGIYITSN